jgi:hypothetical protein
MSQVIGERNMNTQFCNYYGNTSTISLGLEEKIYENGSHYYYINMNTTLQNGEKLTIFNFDNKENPFKDFLYMRAHLDGDIVFKNDLTKLWLDYIFMDDIELSKLSGRITPMQYRLDLLTSILKMCD